MVVEKIPEASNTITRIFAQEDSKENTWEICSKNSDSLWKSRYETLFQIFLHIIKTHVIINHITMVKSSGKNILIVILVVVILLLLGRYVFFRDQIEEWGAWLERIGQWQENYRAENPGATDEEVDAAFQRGIESLEEWKENYKREHSDATDEEVNAAFEAAWEGK